MVAFRYKLGKHLSYACILEPEVSPAEGEAGSAATDQHPERGWWQPVQSSLWVRGKLPASSVSLTGSISVFLVLTRVIQTDFQDE